jgi:hypothetical protein
MIEMVNTSASTVEIGKNVRVGDGEPLELCRDEVVETKVQANYEDRDVEDSEEYESRKQNKVYHVSEADDKASAPRVKKSHNE